MRKINILSQKERRKKRVTAKIREKAKFPVLKVFRSNKHIYSQLIDIERNITLVSESDLKIGGKQKKTKKERAKEVGLKLGKKILALNIKQIVFDRGHYSYAGRVKALVEGVREAGVKI